MSYLYWYFGLGIAFYIFIFIEHKVNEENNSSFTGSSVEMRNLQRLLSLDGLKKLSKHLLSSSFVLIIWPIVAIIGFSDTFTSKTSSKKRSQDFSVRKEDLIELVSVCEVESKEKVNDPLEAVPDLPFGHLNTAWHSFLSENSNNDELWSFSAEWQPLWGAKEFITGYVFVNQGSPHAYFIVMAKKIN